jgi:hypothetical protein
MIDNYFAKMLLVVFAFCPAVCSAESWSLIGGGSGTSTSADLSSIKRTGDLVELWTLWNYEKPQTVNGPTFLSMKQKGIYNCVNHASATTEYAMYSGRNGQGKVIFKRSKPAIFEPARPGSSSGGILQFACAYKIYDETKSDDAFLKDFLTNYPKGCAEGTPPYGVSGDNAIKLCTCTGNQMTKSFSVDELRAMVKQLAMTGSQKQRIAEIGKQCALSLGITRQF